MPHADPEARRAYMRRWRGENREKLREKARLRKRERMADPSYRERLNAKKRERYATDEAHRNRLKELDRAYGKKRSGFTIELFEQALETQAHKCAICEEPLVARGNKTCADHCHETGLARGILCNCCNTGLGYFKDDPKRLHAAVAYLANPPLGIA